MKKKKIVVVDDFTNVLIIVKEVLLKKGYEVIAASTGAEALKFFNGTSIDLLITDFDMPDMDGSVLVSNIRKMSQYVYTPVIMLSGVRKERVAEKIKNLNIACFMQKPFEIKQFYQVIERLI